MALIKINIEIIYKIFRYLLAMIIEIQIVNKILNNHPLRLNFGSKKELKQLKYHYKIVTSQLPYIWRFKLELFDIRDIIDFSIGRTFKEIDNKFNQFIETQTNKKKISCKNFKKTLSQLQNQSHELVFMNRNSMKFITKKYFWIGDPIQIPYLTEILQTEREISVNVEYQTRWSYLGYICLLQIGTRSRDYLIDVINLKNDLEDLNVTFKNCKIIKILNGGKKSITRLKNDLGLNLINVFDANEAIVNNNLILC